MSGAVCRIHADFSLLHYTRWVAVKSYLLACLIVAGAANSATLTVAAYPAVDEIVRAAIPAWKLVHPDVDVIVVSREFSDHHTAMTTALATRSNLPDIMVVEVDYLGRFANSGGLTDLAQPPFNARQYQDRFVAYTFPQATAKTGALTALPGDIGPGTLFYRNDLLQRSGVNIQQLTASWESYVANGHKIKTATGAYLVADARNIKDVMIRSDLKSGEGIYFDTQDRVLVNSPRFQRAFELARQIRRERLDGNVKAWTSEWSESLRSGGVATQMMGAWLGGHLANWLAPETAGLWRASELPEHARIAWGGTFYAIPTKAAQRKLAFEFLQMLTLKRERQLAAFRAQDAFPALLEAQNDAFFDQPVAFLGGQLARKLWRDEAARIRPIPVNKLDSIAAEIVDTALDKVLNNDMPIPDALAEASRFLEYRLRKP
ncbi:MAG: extracellular solute-binding protein [Burkholderiales bacterium]